MPRGFSVLKAQPRDASELARFECLLSLHEQTFMPAALARKLPLVRDLRAVQEREMRALLRSRLSVVFKAVDSSGGAIIGFLAGKEKKHKPRFAKRRYAYLYALFVAPEWRKRGVASALFTEFEKWAKARKLGEISLKVNSRNRAGKAFYSSVGTRCYWLELKKFL